MTRKRKRKHTPGEQRHTAGPWSVPLGTSLVTAASHSRPSGGIIAECFAGPDFGYISRAEAEANARLIAAAPDLLAAAENMLTACDDALVADALEELHAAVKLATGGRQ